jgi:hypothetical protein
LSDRRTRSDGESREDGQQAEPGHRFVRLEPKRLRQG